MFEKMSLGEEKVDSTNVYKGKLLDVFMDHVSLPDGAITTREYIKHNGAVCIVALDGKGNIAVERQFRYPFHREVIEIPAGKLDSSTEDHLEAAKRELREETGITAKKFKFIGELYPSVAYTTEVIYMYLATDLSFGERELDENERINFELMPIEDLVKMIMNNKIGDAKTQLAVLKAWSLINNKTN